MEGRPLSSHEAPLVTIWYARTRPLASSSVATVKRIHTGVAKRMMTFAAENTPNLR